MLKLPPLVPFKATAKPANCPLASTLYARPLAVLADFNKTLRDTLFFGSPLPNTADPLPS